jgi:hypothetical protein
MSGKRVAQLTHAKLCQRFVNPPKRAFIAMRFADTLGSYEE